MKIFSFHSWSRNFRQVRVYVFCDISATEFAIWTLDISFFSSWRARNNEFLFVKIGFIVLSKTQNEDFDFTMALKGIAKFEFTFSKISRERRYLPERQKSSFLALQKPEKTRFHSPKSALPSRRNIQKSTTKFSPSTFSSPSSSFFPNKRNRLTSFFNLSRILRSPISHDPQTAAKDGFQTTPPQRRNLIKSWINWCPKCVIEYEEISKRSPAVNSVNTRTI